MKARETFATSGPRIKVRLFGRLGLAEPTSDPRALVERGYAEGVPMGGTLKGDGKVPGFSVWAMKEPDGANLDRIQIVKGWVDASGEPQDRVYDVAWSGERKRGGMARSPRSATASIRSRPATPMTSAARSCSRPGPTRTLTPSSLPCTTSGYCRSPPRVRLPMTRSAAAWRCSRMCRRRCRNAPGLRPSGTRLDPSERSRRLRVRPSTSRAIHVELCVSDWRDCSCR